MTTGLWIFAAVFVWILTIAAGHMKRVEQREKYVERIRELADDIEIRQLYAQARRHDFRKIAEAWAEFPLIGGIDVAGELGNFEKALETILAAGGLELEGSPKPGLVPADDLTTAEWKKLRDLSLIRRNSVLL